MTMADRMAYVVVNIMNTLVLGYQFFLVAFVWKLFPSFPLSEEMWSDEWLVLAVISILFKDFHL